MSSASIRTGIAVVVVFVWTTASITALFTHDDIVLGAVTPVMLMVVGFLFGYSREHNKISNRSDDLSDW